MDQAESVFGSFDICVAAKIQTVQRRLPSKNSDYLMAAVCAFKSVGAMAPSAISLRAVHEWGCVRSCVRGPAMGFLLMAWVLTVVAGHYKRCSRSHTKQYGRRARPSARLVCISGNTRIILSLSATLRHSLSRLFLSGGTARLLQC